MELNPNASIDLDYTSVFILCECGRKNEYRHSKRGERVPALSYDGGYREVAPFKVNTVQLNDCECGRQVYFKIMLSDAC